MENKEQGMQWMQLLLMGMAFLLCFFFLTRRESAAEIAAGEQVEIKKIAITFDDGPHEIYTPLLLDGLLERHVHASFFVTGQNVEKYPELIRRMDEEGHLIGNHTYHHIQLTNSNGDLFYEELKKTNQVIEQITGKEVEFVRPPFGSWSKKYEQELNMFPVLWNIDPMDWCSDDIGCMVSHVLEKAEENAIILFHDEYDSSVAAALQVIDALQKQGYEFVTVDKLLVD